MTMNADEMLKNLIEQGKITQEDLEELNASVSNHSFRVLVEGLHALLCGWDHDMAECGFHEETTMEGTWERPAHQAWVEYARDIVTRYGISPDRLIDDLRRVSQAVNAIQDMTEGGIEILNAYLEKSPSQLSCQTLAKPPQNPHEETS